ncbi:hypothetical protein JAO84_19475 [Streptomyces fradiae]
MKATTNRTIQELNMHREAYAQAAAAEARRRQTPAALAAGVLWAAVLLVLAAPMSLVFIGVIWGAAAGHFDDGLLLYAAGVTLAPFLIPTLLAFAPSVRRRLSVPGRFLLAGTTALPIAVGIAAWATTWG